METEVRKEPEGKPDRLVVGIVKGACYVLWAAAALVIVSLLVRIGVQLAAGVDNTGSSSVPWIATLYDVTGLLPTLFSPAANVTIPITGVPHLLDVASIMVIAVLFFGTLAVTKLAIWSARAVFGGVRKPVDAPAVQPAPAAIAPVVIEERTLEPVGAQAS
jgi:hypothetical protein